MVNAWLVTRTDGTTKTIVGESYIAGSLATDLVVINEVGAPVATFSAGTWRAIAVVSPNAVPPDTSANTAYQSVITAADPNVAGTYLNSRSIFNGPNG